MQNGLQNALLLVGSYIITIVLGYIIVNFLTKGFLYEYIKVKLSRGKLILVKCHDATDSYYKASKLDAKRNLRVKDRAKQIYVFSGIKRDYVGRELGVNILEVDLVSMTIINKNFDKISSYDITATDDLVNRAAKLPRLESNKMTTEKILAILTLVGIIIAIILSVALPSVLADKIAEKVAQALLSSATGGTI